MSSRKWGVVNGFAFRMTLVDSCGLPVYGANSRLVSDGFVEAAVTVNVDDGTAIELRNARGVKQINVKARPKIDNYAVNLTFTKVDPEAFGLSTGQRVVYSAENGDAIGFVVDSEVRPTDSYLALELWSEVGEASCDDSGNDNYGYLLFPFLTGGVFGDYTLANGAVSFAVNNMQTQDGSQWGAGPYEVMRDAGGDPSVLLGNAVIGLTDHHSAFYTSVAPPALTDGTVPLDDPEATPATTATAGIPGTFNGNRPDTSMSGITASPTSAWTTGQYVETENGAKFHWTGTVWAAGAAS